MYVLIFQVTNTKVDCVEPPKKRTSFLESITTSAVEEANMKSRKRQSSDSESEYSRGHMGYIMNLYSYNSCESKEE